MAEQGHPDLIIAHPSLFTGAAISCGMANGQRTAGFFFSLKCQYIIRQEEIFQVRMTKRQI